MNYSLLIPVSISLGLIGLGAFFWALRHAQYDDLDGAAARILDAPDRPASSPPEKKNLHAKMAAKLITTTPP
ncbi:MAG: cbb3-type cytochrome oxidase assembly protein CcoS [Paracoccaceae bacterium]